MIPILQMRLPEVLGTRCVYSQGQIGLFSLICSSLAGHTLP